MQHKLRYTDLRTLQIYKEDRMLKRFGVLVILAVVFSALFFLFAEFFPRTSGPSPADWEMDPTATVVTWYLVNGDAGGVYRYEIYAILEDSRGWQRAGVDFQEAGSRAEADIVIYMYDVRADYLPCGEYAGLRACTFIRTSGFWRNYTIYLPNISPSQAFTMFVNHEVGHSLEFNHIADLLMRLTFTQNKKGNVVDGPYWPTNEEIEILRQRLK